MVMHVVCLDGTGQQRPQPNPTNISLIFDSLGGVVTDGGNGSWESTLTLNGAVVQTAKYLPGVGAQGNLILQALGKGFGARIAAVGVFDTVSSVGLPEPDATGWIGYDFDIADTVLNPSIAAGFHALSADETRAVFVATYWTPRAGVTQVIFPGNHSNVGGGYPETGLSDRALEWMLGSLTQQGMRSDPQNLPRPLAPNPIDIARNEAGDLPWVFLPSAPRDFPTDPFTGEPAFTADASIGQRWGRPVTVMTAGTTSDYQSVGMSGDRPLYP